MPPDFTTWLLVLVKLLLAVVLGGAVGWQREAYEKPAGFRTHILVCVGAATYTLVSLWFIGETGRVAASVAAGMGFLGAGTIIRYGSVVRGLTTAASLWAVAAIGMAAALGWPAVEMTESAITATAVLGTAVVLLSLTVMTAIERRIASRTGLRQLELQLSSGGRAAVPDLLALVQAQRVQVERIEFGGGGGRDWVRLHLQVTAVADAHALVTALAARPEVQEAVWL